MTFNNSFITLNTPCSFTKLCPSKKVTRLICTVSIIVFISFCTYFLYLHTNISTGSIKSTSYPPIAFTEQQHDFTLIKDKNTFGKNGSYQNHNKMEIKALLKKYNHVHQQKETESLPMADVTVLLHATENNFSRDLKAEIKSILAQTIHPKYLYITYNNEAIKKAVEKLLQKYSIQVRFFYTKTTAGDLFVRDSFWLLQHYSILTEYVWILESNAVFDSRYLQYTIGLSKTDEYKSTLIGYEASTLTFNSNQLNCIQSHLISNTQRVDMIHGGWLLRSSWIQLLKQEISSNAVVALDLPVAYFVSSSLLYRANIPSVAIPSDLKTSSPSFCSSKQMQDLRLSTFNSVLPNVQDHQRFLQQQTNGRLVLLFDDVNSALELFPLMCRLINAQDKQVHIILANGLTKPTFEDTIRRMGCVQGQTNPAIIHDLTMAYNNGISQAFDTISADYLFPIVRLLEFIEPQVVIRAKSKQNSYYTHLVEAAMRAQGIVPIFLPEGQVEHALWISDLSIEALRHWNDIKIDLVVITDRRPQSLSRLLQSTNEAHYLGDNQLELVIHMEQSADIVTRSVVQSFEWNHGNKKIRHRIRKGGLMPAIVESWYPSDNNNYGLLLEDDIELSPLFYAWSKYNILKYRYSPNQEKAYQRIYGVSLYSPRNLELLPEGRRPFNPEPVLENSGYSKRAPYASQVPCSWGAVYFPEHWREFHTYLTARLEKEEWKGYHNITVPKSRSDKWKKSWKKYFIELVYLRAYVMMYPNFENFESFSTNHLEFGTHVKEKGRTQSKVEQFLVPLMQRDTILEQMPYQQLPIFENLPLMDLWGNIRSMEELDKIGSDWHRRISSCERKSGEFDPTDLLCPFDVNAEKYLNKTMEKSK